jgi:hypothetical protein
MLPKLYTLRKVLVAGHLRRTVPFSINCVQCGRQVDPCYKEFEFVLDSLPQCDLIQSNDADVYLISERLLAELERIDAKGYQHRSIADISLSGDFRRSYPNFCKVSSEIKRFQYLTITGKCDGPWIRNTRGATCAICDQPTPELKDFDATVSEIMGDVSPQSLFVFPETWHGEDIFYLSEPGPPLITERIASILTKTGNLRKEKVMDKDTVRRLMPEYAQDLERRNWQIEPCIELGPADWSTGDPTLYSSAGH